MFIVKELLQKVYSKKILWTLVHNIIYEDHRESRTRLRRAKHW